MSIPEEATLNDYLKIEESTVNKENKTNNKLKTPQRNGEIDLQTLRKISLKKIKPLSKFVAKRMKKRKRNDKISETLTSSTVKERIRKNIES